MRIVLKSFSVRRKDVKIDASAQWDDVIRFAVFAREAE